MLPSVKKVTQGFQRHGKIMKFWKMVNSFSRHGKIMEYEKKAKIMEFQNASWNNHGILFFDIFLHAFEIFSCAMRAIGYFHSI